MKIKKETITRYVNVLIELQQLCDKNNGFISGIEGRAICKKNKVSSGVLTYAVGCGLVTKPKSQHYKFNVVAIEPIHARKCLEYRVKVRALKKQNLKPVLHTVTVEKEMSKPIVTTRSYLWGLIKITTTK